MWPVIRIPLGDLIAQADVKRLFFVLFRVVLFVEFVENPKRLRPGEDADGFDGVTALVGPSTFFWAAILLPDFVDGDGCGLSFELVGVAVVPLTEAFSSLDRSFLVPRSVGVH